MAKDDDTEKIPPGNFVGHVFGAKIVSAQAAVLADITIEVTRANEKVATSAVAIGRVITDAVAASGDKPDDGVDALKPPKFAEFVLYLFTPRDIREAAPGDLEEMYQTEILPKLGPRGARIWYWGQVTRSVGPLILTTCVKAIIWLIRQLTSKSG